MNKEKVLFMDIDTQCDFMDTDGKLYIKNAELIKPNLKKLVDFSKKNDIYILSSIDVHIEDDPEFKNFPPHCIVETSGYEKIEETQLDDPVIIYENADIQFNKVQKQYIIEKKELNLFTNIDTERFLEFLKPEMCIVFGVATDYCVKIVVNGLLKRGYKVTIVKDAIMGIDEVDSQTFLDDMINQGVPLVKTDDLLKGLS